MAWRADMRYAESSGMPLCSTHPKRPVSLKIGPQNQIQIPLCPPLVYVVIRVFFFSAVNARNKKTV